MNCFSFISLKWSLESEMSNTRARIISRECAKTRDICKDLVALGALVFVLHGNNVVSGLPDRLIVHRDWSGLLEFKDNNTELRANQRINIKNMVLRDPDFAYIVRFPNLIQLPCDQIVNSDGYYTVATFDGTARGLLDTLIKLKNYGDS